MVQVNLHLERYRNDASFICFFEKLKEEILTHAEISPREVQIPGLGRRSEQYREQRVTHGDVPSSFLHEITRGPKSSDFHVKSSNGD